MSKAEERAKETYPLRDAEHVYDEERVIEAREYFIQGYNQAEKDLELGWEDIRTILNIENDILSECNSQKKLVIVTYPKGEDYYGEILKRFKEMKDNESK
jgi:pyruvate-formate lyase-activating enzyme